MVVTGCRCRRWTRCAASWRTISASSTCRRTSWPSTRRSARPARQAWTSPRRPGRDGGRKRGLYDQVAAEFAAEVDRLAELATRSLGSPGEGLAAVELAIRTAMTQLGASLLGRLLAADTGHRGPRIDCGAGHCAPGSSATGARRSRPCWARSNWGARSLWIRRRGVAVDHERRESPLADNVVRRRLLPVASCLVTGANRLSVWRSRNGRS
jgi:hypothetical protein